MLLEWWKVYPMRPRNVQDFFGLSAERAPVAILLPQLDDGGPTLQTLALSYHKQVVFIRVASIDSMGIRNCKRG